MRMFMRWNHCCCTYQCDAPPRDIRGNLTLIWPKILAPVWGRGGPTCVLESLQVQCIWPGRYHVTAMTSMHWTCSDSSTHVGPPLSMGYLTFVSHMYCALIRIYFNCIHNYFAGTLIIPVGGFDHRILPHHGEFDLGYGQTPILARPPRGGGGGAWHW